MSNSMILSEGYLFSKTCHMCMKEEKAYLVFWIPKGWIKHKTPDGLDMLFCSLACFQEFTGAKLVPRPVEPKKHHEAVEEPLVAVPAK